MNNCWNQSLYKGWALAYDPLSDQFLWAAKCKFIIERLPLVRGERVLLISARTGY
jgi:hypothetical protein